MDRQHELSKRQRSLNHMISMTDRRLNDSVLILKDQRIALDTVKKQVLGSRQQCDSTVERLRIMQAELFEPEQYFSGMNYLSELQDELNQKMAEQVASEAEVAEQEKVVRQVLAKKKVLQKQQHQVSYDIQQLMVNKNNMAIEDRYLSTWLQSNNNEHAISNQSEVS